MNKEEFQFVPGGPVVELCLSEEDREFIGERDRRQERAGKSGKVIVGPVKSGDKHG